MNCDDDDDNDDEKAGTVLLGSCTFILYFLVHFTSVPISSMAILLLLFFVPVFH